MNRVEPGRNVYVGHRYVPLLVGEWDKSNQYEGLSIVTFKGGSYTSKKMTPPGIDIENEEYWVLTGNYNAQVEYYRQETERVSNLLDTKASNEELSDFKTELNNNFNTFKTETNENINTFKTETDENINTFKTETNENINTFKTETDENINTFKTETNEKINKKADSEYVNSELNKIVVDITDDIEENTDITDYLQDVINNNSGSEIRIRGNGKYNLKIKENEDYAIKVINNTRLVMNDEVTLKLINSNMERYSMFDMTGVKNVYIESGKLIGDRYENISTSGEWGMGYNIRSSDNITLINTTTSNFWGDGVYIGRAPQEHPSRDILSSNIYIEGLISNNNRRQGMSIIAINGGKFLNCEFKNTNGALPEAGVDIETNLDNEDVINVEFKECISKNNHGQGMLLDLRYKGIGKNISFINCDFSDNHKSGFRMTGRGEFKAENINVIGCNINSMNEDYSIELYGYNYDLSNLTVKNNKIIGNSALIEGIKELEFSKNYINLNDGYFNKRFLSDCYFLNNKYEDCSRSFSSSAGLSENIVIDGNTFINNNENAIVTNDLSSKYKIVNNTFINSIQPPINFRSFSSIVSNNIFLDTVADYAISLSSSSSNTISTGNLCDKPIYDNGNGNIVLNNHSPEV